MTDCPGQIWGDCSTRVGLVEQRQRLTEERDHYRAALETINREFIECANGEVKTYAGPVAALDCIRIEVRNALGLDQRPRQDSNLQPPG